MSSNPKGSPWRSTPNARRGRPGYVVTMAPESWERLDAECARLGCSRGDWIERALLREVGATTSPAASPRGA